jgi:maleate isomerase
MYGSRARLGRINPSPETVGDEEWRKLSPDDVIVVSTRMFIERVDKEGLTAMVKNVERAARELATARANVILMAGTAGAFNGGPGFDRELICRMEEAADVPATTTMTAVLQALAALNIGKLAIATSYIPEIDAALAEVLRAEGVDVVGIKGMGLLKSIDMGDLHPQATMRFAQEAFSQMPEADGYLISCGNLRALETVQPLEALLGKPVITSNLAGMWKSLRMAGVPIGLSCFSSRLFQVQ